MDDEVDVEVEAFNRRVLNENFNRVVCEELAKHLGGELVGLGSGLKEKLPLIARN